MSTPCPREATQQSEWSPSVVNDDEDVVLVLLDPDQWQEGALTQSAFPMDRLKTGTVSLVRREHSSSNEVQEQVVTPQLTRNPNRKLVGGLAVVCSEVRALLTNADQVKALCVVDDGREDFRAHSVMGFSEATKIEKFWSRNARAAVRGNLMTLFENSGAPLSLADCFDS